MDARTRLMLGRTIGQPAPAYAMAAAPAPAGPLTTCCGPCQDLGFCRDDANCCLECHFGYEEQLAFPYLPEEGRRILHDQHRWLMANGFPHEELEAHAEYEMLWFRASGCPPEIIAQIEHDHAEYGEGRLHSREIGVFAPEPPTIIRPSLAPIPVAGRWVGPYDR